MTSPWLREPIAQTVTMLVPSLRNLTEPSHIRMLQPPGWKLLRPYMPGFWMPLFAAVCESQFGYFGFGGSRTLPRVVAMRPKAQHRPRLLVWFVRPPPVSCAAARQSFSHVWKFWVQAGSLAAAIVGPGRVTPVGSLPRKMMSEGIV